MDAMQVPCSTWLMRWIDRALKVAKQKGITQRDIARAAGVEPPRVNQWKRGAGKPYLDQAVKIARLLGVSLDWLAAEGEAEAPAPFEGPRTLDDALILRAVQVHHLTTDEALRRLAGDGPGRGTPVEVVAERTLSKVKAPGNPGRLEIENAPGPRK